MVAVEIECVPEAKDGVGGTAVRRPEAVARHRGSGPGRASHRSDPVAGEARPRPVGRGIGRLAMPHRGGGGSVLAALRHGFGLLDLGTGAPEPLYDPETNPPAKRFSADAVDPRGRYRVGIMSMVVVGDHDVPARAPDPNGFAVVPLDRPLNSPAGGTPEFLGPTAPPDRRDPVRHDLW